MNQVLMNILQSTYMQTKLINILHVHQKETCAILQILSHLITQGVKDKREIKKLSHLKLDFDL